MAISMVFGMMIPKIFELGSSVKVSNLFFKRQDPEITISLENKWMSGWRKYSYALVVQSKKDNVIVKDVLINRGGCSYPRNYRYPFLLNYGDTMTLHVNGCRVIDALVSTNIDDYNFEFQNN